MGKFETVLELLATGSNLLALGKKQGVSGMMKAAPTIIKEDGPNLFGIGFDDESLWLDAVRKAETLKPGTCAKITALKKVMLPYEDYCLRMVVTNMKLPSEVKKSGDQAVITYSADPNQDPRVQALLFIAGQFDQGPTEEEVPAKYIKLSADDLEMADIMRLSLLPENEILVRVTEAVSKLPPSNQLMRQAQRVREMLRDHNLIREENKFVEVWQQAVNKIEVILNSKEELEKLRPKKRNFAQRVIEFFYVT